MKVCIWISLGQKHLCEGQLSLRGIKAGVSFIKLKHFLNKKGYFQATVPQDDPEKKHRRPSPLCIFPIRPHWSWSSPAVAQGVTLSCPVSKLSPCPTSTQDFATWGKYWGRERGVWCRQRQRIRKDSDLLQQGQSLVKSRAGLVSCYILRDIQRCELWYDQISRGVKRKPHLEFTGTINH